MAKVFGAITPSAGTGVKSINLGITGCTRLHISTAMTGAGYIAEAQGDWVGGTQRYRSSTQGWGSSLLGTVLEVVNNLGVVVYQASVQSISGSTLNWNVTVATITPTLLLNGDDYA